MVRLAAERVLLIGDTTREVYGALLQAVPAAQVSSVPSIFDGIAELAGATPTAGQPGTGYTSVIAAAEPIERRPEAAVRTLRALAGDGRLILFGHPTLEILSRKMLQFGCDDYLLLPADPGELQQIFVTPPARPAGKTGGPAGKSGPAPAHAAPGDDGDEWAEADSPDDGPAAALARAPLADLLLDAQLQHPHDPLAAVLKQLNALIAPAWELVYRPAPGDGSDGADLPDAAGRRSLAQPVRAGGDPSGTLYLLLDDEAGGDETPARHALAQVAHLAGKVAALADRHNRLQKLAITDEMTGLYNGRYFRHFLTRIVERARQMHFPVTLLLFDIDDFKKYNDRFGHGVGDEILKQTAALMKRCTREHDLVARIGGDEFAVVFWDKEGPRQPRDPRPGGGHASGRPPQTPVLIFERFKKLIGSDQFTALGPGGKGTLGISAGLAVFPYEAQDVAGLIKEADKRLMHGAKRAGKNTLFIVGTDDPPAGRGAKG